MNNFEGQSAKPLSVAHSERRSDQATQVDANASSPETLQSSSVRVPPVLKSLSAILMIQQLKGNQAVERILTVQPSAELHEPSYEEIHSAATEGIRTPATTLPYLDRIQTSFGRHSIGHIKAHVGPEAARASRAMSALAFASGDHVVFGGRPDLRTAAHEAAHIIQQQAGVQLDCGIGREGDAYECNADAVADAVVRGQSAEGLLAPFAALGSAEPRSALQYQQSTSGSVIQRAIGAEIELPNCLLQVKDDVKQGTVLGEIALEHKVAEIHAENPRMAEITVEDQRTVEHAESPQNEGKKKEKKKEKANLRVATLEYATGIYEQEGDRESQLARDLLRLEKITEEIKVGEAFFKNLVVGRPKSIVGTFQVNISPKERTGDALHSIFETEERVSYEANNGSLASMGISQLHRKHAAIRGELIRYLSEILPSRQAAAGNDGFLEAFFKDATTVVSSIYIASYHEAARNELYKAMMPIEKERRRLTETIRLIKSNNLPETLKLLQKRLIENERLLRPLRNEYEILSHMTPKNFFLLFPRFDIQRTAEVIAVATGEDDKQKARATGYKSFEMAIDIITIPEYPDYLFPQAQSPVHVPIPSELRQSMKEAARQLMIEGLPLIPDRNRGQGPNTPGTILKRTSSSLVSEKQASEGVYEIRNPFDGPVPLDHWAKALRAYELYLAGKGVKY